VPWVENTLLGEADSSLVLLVGQPVREHRSRIGAGLVPVQVQIDQVQASPEDRGAVDAEASAVELRKQRRRIGFRCCCRLVQPRLRPLVVTFREEDPAEQVEALDEVVLVCGPTGSGKTTTL